MKELNQVTLYRLNTHPGCRGLSARKEFTKFIGDSSQGPNSRGHKGRCLGKYVFTYKPYDQEAASSYP